jgi:signal transduction histidine kinase/ligand-binding sensor domain-containing protein
MKAVLGILFAFFIGIGSPHFVLSSEADSRQPTLSVRKWGLFDGIPGAMLAVQSDDGTLWLVGYGGGLYRFDGTRFTSYVSPSGYKPLARGIYSLQSWPNQGIWVGLLYGGISVIQGNHRTDYTESDGLPGGSVYSIFKDPAGTVWATTRGGLARLKGARWERVPLVSESHESIDAFQVLFDHSGTQWVFSPDRLYSRAPGQEMFRERARLASITNSPERSVALSADGDLWVTDPDGLTRFSTRPNIGTLKVPGLHGPVLFDREGNLWLGSSPPQRRIRWLSRAACASVNDATELEQKLENLIISTDEADDRQFINPVFQDREHNIWASGSEGLYRFSRSPIAVTSLPDEKAPRYHSTLAVDGSGTLWASSLYFDHSEIVKVGPDRLGPPLTAPRITVSYRDRDGTLWFGGPGNITHFAHGALATISLPDWMGDSHVQTLLTDATGALWVTVIRKGLFREVNGSWIKNGGYAQLPEPYPIVANTDSSGVLWFGYPHKVARIQDGRVQVFSAPEGADVGNVTAIQTGAHTWIGGDAGIARFDGRRFIPLLGSDRQAFPGITGIIEADSGDLWLNGSLGIAHIQRSEVSHYLADPRYQSRYELFNRLDGLPATASVGAPFPTAVATPDGRLWFTVDSATKLISIDPKHIPRNSLAPPVKIWSVTAQGRTYDVGASALIFPVRTTALQIDYTAGSLTVPERVRFRYKLDGLDKDWQDGGNRREVFYTNLAPGPYTFHVVASNNDGVWNETGDALRFTIQPAWYQTRWFHMLCGLVALVVLAGLHRARLIQVRADTRRLMEARLSERERIARDLHDTLLQSMQGLMLRFRAVANAIPDKGKLRDMMERALGRAEQVIIESRDKVKEIRAQDAVSASLPDALAAVAARFDGPTAPPLRLTIEGDPIELHPLVREEALLISREAIANALLHANARDIEVELSYGSSALHVRVRDDGAGISPDVISNGREGHWGLAGMRERARKLQAKLDIWSTPGAGTEVELIVPAAIAYRGVTRTAVSTWRRRIAHAFTGTGVAEVVDP